MSVTLGQPVSVRLPDDLLERVTALAQVTRRSRGDVIREILEDHLHDAEWEHRVADRARQHRAGTQTAVSAEEVDKILGLEGTVPSADALASIS